jgi:hypothetical protein
VVIRKTIRAIQLAEGYQLKGSSVPEVVKKRVSCKNAAVKRKFYV